MHADWHHLCLPRIDNHTVSYVIQKNFGQYHSWPAFTELGWSQRRKTTVEHHNAWIYPTSQACVQHEEQPRQQAFKQTVVHVKQATGSVQIQHIGNGMKPGMPKEAYTRPRLSCSSVALQAHSLASASFAAAVHTTILPPLTHAHHPGHSGCSLHGHYQEMVIVRHWPAGSFTCNLALHFIWPLVLCPPSTCAQPCRCIPSRPYHFSSTKLRPPAQPQDALSALRPAPSLP